MICTRNSRKTQIVKCIIIKNVDLMFQCKYSNIPYMLVNLIDDPLHVTTCLKLQWIPVNIMYCIKVKR